MNMIDCFALYGTVNWEMNDVQEYVSAIPRVFSHLNVPATHYGYCETPPQKYGPRIGSFRNVQKKISALHANGLKLKSLEFFSLPRGYNLPYSDYRAYFGRGVGHLVLAYDLDECNLFAEDALISEMCNHILGIWGEHFQIKKGDQPVTRCWDQCENNPYGQNLSHDFSIRYYDSIPVHVIRQFKL